MIENHLSQYPKLVQDLRSQVDIPGALDIVSSVNTLILLNTGRVLCF